MLILKERLFIALREHYPKLQERSQSAEITTNVSVSSWRSNLKTEPTEIPFKKLTTPESHSCYKSNNDLIFPNTSYIISGFAQWCVSLETCPVEHQWLFVPQMRSVWLILEKPERIILTESQELIQCSPSVCVLQLQVCQTRLGSSSRVAFTLHYPKYIRSMNASTGWRVNAQGQGGGVVPGSVWSLPGQAERAHWEEGLSNPRERVKFKSNDVVWQKHCLCVLKRLQ